MKSAAMESVIRLLKGDPRVSDYKLNVSKKESFELFYVKGKLETVRATDTCDRQVTVYADHGGFRGDALFYVYPSTDEAGLREKLEEAVRNALLINNAPYTLPAGETGEDTLPGNLKERPMAELAQEIGEAVFAANTQEGGSLNAVEVFIDHYTDTVANSRGLFKVQHRYTAMVEAIPTFNGDKESVELYEQYNFSTYDRDTLVAEIAEKMTAVSARYHAVKPQLPLEGKVVLHKLELNDLFTALAGDLNYATVYGHGNLFSKGDRVQKDPQGDRITLTMQGAAEGSVASASFDSDGLSLGKITLIREGKVENYYGSNRFGQYLGEQPTGSLSVMCVAPGTAAPIEGEPWLEVLSMSGLQVDFFNDYIGGEIRLAYYHHDGTFTPVTGISISGKLQEVLDRITFSPDTAVYDGYVGPATAVLTGMKVF